MGLFDIFRKPDTEQIGASLAQEMPDDLSDREMNGTLAAIARACEMEAGMSANEADEVARAAYRQWLIQTGQAHLYPEIF